MTPTDDQLKLALAKALPELITYVDWRDTGQSLLICHREGPKITDWEWLHVCALVEAKLTDEQHHAFRAALWQITDSDGFLMGSDQHNRSYISADWRAHSLALAAIGAITIE